MNKEKIDIAEEEVNDTYMYLADAVKEITKPITEKLDNIVKELSKGINLFTNAQLWDFQMLISIEAYNMGVIKEQTSLKQSCAEALYKESIATSYSLSSGTQEAKKQQSIIDTVDKQAVNMLWSAVTNTLKTKCDEAHRLVNAIQNIQISRAAEAKQFGSPRSEVDNINFNGQGDSE